LTGFIHGHLLIIGSALQGPSGRLNRHCSITES
jgi:Uri superfamily endonuclease